MEGRNTIEVELLGRFKDSSGKLYEPGKYPFASEITLTPADPASSAFAVPDMTIGIGFHWQRNERQVFRGPLRIIRKPAGLTLINDVSLEEYVTSVISSEMSASCPIELLKAHAVISRSWLWFPKAEPPAEIRGRTPESPEFSHGDLESNSGDSGVRSREIRRWYGR